jgi:NarL family two-component system response regulator LiaR
METLPMDSSIRVLIVDDHRVVRIGIRTLLETTSDIVVIGEAGDGEEAILVAGQLRPDVILMDLMMPRMSGIAAIERILAARPETHVLVVTGFAGDEMVFSAIRAGALGYILKDFDSADLLHAIRRVACGESSLHPVIARRVLRERAHPQQPVAAAEALTEREVGVLRLVARGESNHGIAAALNIGEGTVRRHVSNILSKLHLDSRTQAALYALRHGLASIEVAKPNM